MKSVKNAVALSLICFCSLFSARQLLAQSDGVLFGDFGLSSKGRLYSDVGLVDEFFDDVFVGPRVILAFTGEKSRGKEMGLVTAELSFRYGDLDFLNEAIDEDRGLLPTTIVFNGGLGASVLSPAVRTGAVYPTVSFGISAYSVTGLGLTVGGQRIFLGGDGKALSGSSALMYFALSIIF